MSLCPSVCLSARRVNCDKTKETSANILIPHERTLILIFGHEWLAKGPLVPEILGQIDPVRAKTPVFNRQRGLNSLQRDVAVFPPKFGEYRNLAAITSKR